MAQAGNAGASAAAARSPGDPCFSGRCRGVPLPGSRTICKAQLLLHAPAARCPPAALAGLASSAAVAIPASLQAKRGRRGVAVQFAAAEASSAGGAPEHQEAGPLAAAGRFLYSLYKFSRPHTMLGTSASILSVSALACASSTVFTAAMATGLTQALVAALLMNISIVG